MDFKILLQDELQIERDFLRQYKFGLKSVEKYAAYRLTQKRGKEFLAVNRRTKKEFYIKKSIYYIISKINTFFEASNHIDLKRCLVIKQNRTIYFDSPSHQKTPV